MKDNYTSAEVAEMFGISDRTVRRHLQTIADSMTAKDKGYIIPLDIVRLMAGRFNYELPTDINGQYDHVEYFTNEEYQEFHKRLVEYPLFKKHIENLKIEIEHHKNQYEKLIRLHNDFVQAHKSSLKIIEQRNFIEAKEKDLNN